MKTLAEFDKPYDALLIQLKDELQAHGIDFTISGENGSAIQYTSVIFTIKVMVDESTFPSALEIYRGLAAQQKKSR